MTCKGLKESSYHANQSRFILCWIPLLLWLMRCSVRSLSFMVVDRLTITRLFLSRKEENRIHVVLFWRLLVATHRFWWKTSSKLDVPVDTSVLFLYSACSKNIIESQLHKWKKQRTRKCSNTITGSKQKCFEMWCILYTKEICEWVFRKPNSYS